MDARGRRVLGITAGLLLGVPAAMAAAVILTVPPVRAWLPAGVAAAAAPVAGWVFGTVAALPPGSLAGQAFYGSFAALGWLGPQALAAHAALLGLPWLLPAWLVARGLWRGWPPLPGGRAVTAPR